MDEMEVTPLSCLSIAHKLKIAKHFDPDGMFTALAVEMGLGTIDINWIKWKVNERGSYTLGLLEELECNSLPSSVEKLIEAVKKCKIEPVITYLDEIYPSIRSSYLEFKKLNQQKRIMTTQEGKHWGKVLIASRTGLKEAKNINCFLEKNQFTVFRERKGLNEGEKLKWLNHVLSMVDYVLIVISPSCQNKIQPSSDSIDSIDLQNEYFIIKFILKLMHTKYHQHDPKDTNFKSILIQNKNLKQFIPILVNEATVSCMPDWMVKQKVHPYKWPGNFQDLFLTLVKTHAVVKSQLRPNQNQSGSHCRDCFRFFSSDNADPRINLKNGCQRFLGNGNHGNYHMRLLAPGDGNVLVTADHDERYRHHSMED